MQVERCSNRKGSCTRNKIEKLVKIFQLNAEKTVMEAMGTVIDDSGTYLTGGFKKTGSFLERQPSDSVGAVAKFGGLDPRV